MTEPAPTDPVPTRIPTWYVVTASLTGLLLIATIGAAFWFSRDLAAEDDEEAGRADAVAAAKVFVSEFWTYSYAEPEAYVDRVSPLLTEQARPRFQQDAQTILEYARAREIDSAATVGTAALESFDGDSASVLVVVDITARTPAGANVSYGRQSLELSLVDGEWQVSQTPSNVAS